MSGFRAASTVVAPVQTMNSPPLSRLEYGPEGFHPVCMRHALEVFPDRGIGAIRDRAAILDPDRARLLLPHPGGPPAPRALVT